MPQLKPTQAIDAAKLAPMTHALIGHEQGLGKTILGAQQLRPGSVVVCPSSVILNWVKELSIWRPELKVQPILRNKDEVHVDTEVLVISWGMLNTHPGVPVPYVLVGDESQNIKNREAKRSRKFAELARDADEVYLLSGTPMPNRTRELWTQLRCLKATDLSYAEFTRKYSDAHQARFGWDDSGASNVDELRDLLNTVMVRRDKTDPQIAAELPPKVHQIIEIDAPVSRAEREIALSAAQAIRTVGHLDAKTVPFEEQATFRKDSGLRKIKDVIDFCHDLLNNERKLVVFAHHKEVIAAYMKAFKAAGYAPVRIDGSSSVGSRQHAVEQFQDPDSDCRVLVGNIIAAGTGITATAASSLVFGEIDWVPGNNAQASDRVHRYGQGADCVNIYYIVARDGIDHRLLEALLEKEETINQVVTTTTEEG